LLREKYNIDETAMGVVTQEDIEEVVARWTGVPVTSIKEEEGAKLLRIEEELHKRINSPGRGIYALSRAVQWARFCSLARPVSARRRWPALSPRSCLARSALWCALTCRNSWKSTRFQS